MDTERHEQHRMGDNVPEGAQFTGREAVSSGVSDLLRGTANVFGGTGRTTNTAEIRTDGKEDQGDAVRCLRRKLGEGDITRRGMDVPL